MITQQHVNSATKTYLWRILDSQQHSEGKIHIGFSSQMPKGYVQQSLKQAEAREIATYDGSTAGEVRSNQKVL